MTQQNKRLAGILAGAYTCEMCNSPSAAAIDDRGQLCPACEKHAQQAERAGLRVIWKVEKPESVQ